MEIETKFKKRPLKIVEDFLEEHKNDYIEPDLHSDSFLKFEPLKGFVSMIER
jgi:hypothetical protein